MLGYNEKARRDGYASRSLQILSDRAISMERWVRPNGRYLG